MTQMKDLKISVSMSEYMETFGMRALSLDNEGDDGEEDLGAPEDEDDNNDDEEPGQICMCAVCVVCHKVAMSECWEQSNQRRSHHQCHQCRYYTTAGPRGILKVGWRGQSDS